MFLIKSSFSYPYFFSHLSASSLCVKFVLTQEEKTFWYKEKKMDGNHYQWSIRTETIQSAYLNIQRCFSFLQYSTARKRVYSDIISCDYLNLSSYTQLFTGVVKHINKLPPSKSCPSNLYFSFMKFLLCRQTLAILPPY